MIDWQKIKTEYITTDTSYRKLAQKYGIDSAVIGRRAKSEDWVNLRQQHINKTQTKTLNAIASQQASRASRLQTVADKLLTKVEQLVDEGEGLLKDTSVMRDIARVLKDIKDIQMIRSDADMLEQEARIAKLRKEAEKDDGSHAPTLIVEGLPEEFKV